MALDLMRVKKGFSINDEIDIIYGSADPSDGAGVAAPAGSTYHRTSDGSLWHKTGVLDTDWKMLLDSSGASTEDTYQNDFMGKVGTGSELPNYTEQNHILDNDDLATAIDKLDMYIGGNPVPVTRTNNPIVAGNDVNQNIDALDQAIGADADCPTPNYVVLNSSILSKIKALDTAIYNKNPYTIKADNIDVNPAVAVDSLPIADYMSALWKVTIRDNAAPGNIYSSMVNAVWAGSNIDFTEYAIIRCGSKITGLDIDVVINGSNAELTIFATSANVDYRVERISQEVSL